MSHIGEIRVVLVLLLLLALGLAAAADGVIVERCGKPGPPGKAVVIWEGLRLHMTPGPVPETVARATCGDVLITLGERRNDRLRVQAGEVIGWAAEEGMVEVSAPRADAQVLAAALEYEQPSEWTREPDVLSALALYSRHLELFPESSYRALARYRFGQMAERLALETTEEVERALLEAGEQSEPEEVEWERLLKLEQERVAKYARWGLVLKYSPLGRYYYYGGEAYQSILEDHPESQWADEAAYGLVKVKRSKMGEWEGYPERPSEELGHWQAFTERYPGSELRPKALLEMVYVHRALHEIFLVSPEEDVRDEVKAGEHRQAAQELAERVVRECPETLDAAQAEQHLADLARGRHIYMFGSPPTAAPADAAQ